MEMGKNEWGLDVFLVVSVMGLNCRIDPGYKSKIEIKANS